MFYYTLAALFAQLAITLRLVATPDHLTPTAYDTQGVCRDGEESMDRLLPAFYEFRTGCFRNSCLDPLCVASRYDLPFP